MQPFAERDERFADIMRGELIRISRQLGLFVSCASRIKIPRCTLFPQGESTHWVAARLDHVNIAKVWELISDQVDNLEVLSGRVVRIDPGKQGVRRKTNTDSPGSNRRRGEFDNLEGKPGTICDRPSPPVGTVVGSG